jgi:ribosomal protein L16 Arg81 hydroxylase
MINTLADQYIAKSWNLSPEWWSKKFSKVTGEGIKPYLFKKIVPDGFLGVEEVTDAFKLMQRMQNSKKVHARIYISEERRDDMVEKVLESKFIANESLPEFIIRVTKEKRFSLILNRLQDWSEPITASIGTFLQSMFAQRGIPIGGSEMVVFAGNYIGTAFGVHRGFEHAFLVHLGPGKKEFHCWSEELYKELTGSLNPTFGDYEHLLASSEKFVLEPGDILYLPALVFHVGKQEDFSVSIACPLYTYPIKRLVKQLFLDLTEQIPFDEAGTSAHGEFIDTTNPMQKIVGSVMNDTFNYWMKEQIPVGLDEYWFRLISNGGFDLPENPGDEVMLSSSVQLEANSTIRLKKPYKICWSISNSSDGNIQVFLRGQSVFVPYSEEIIVLFKYLNGGHEKTLTDLGSIASYLQEISRTNGFDIT